MSNHDDSCEAQGPGESCCCVYRAEIERLRERITTALDALNDGDSSGAALILYETVRKK
jgi:hypothetical protein